MVITYQVDKLWPFTLWKGSWKSLVWREQVTWPCFLPTTFNTPLGNLFTRKTPSKSRLFCKDIMSFSKKRLFPLLFTRHYHFPSKWTGRQEAIVEEPVNFGTMSLWFNRCNVLRDGPLIFKCKHSYFQYPALAANNFLGVCLRLPANTLFVC